MSVMKLLTRNYYRMKKLHPRWREGQRWFNALCEVDSNLADEIRGDFDLDPFHRDETIPAFLKWVEDLDTKRKELSNE